jgi:hypothetical protein
MSKKNNKKDEFRASPFDYMGGGRIRELGDRYGVDHKDYNINYGRDTGNGGRQYKGDRDDYDKAVAAAAMRDYDTRRTMEARYMSGDKDAKKYAKKGFKNVADVVAANDLMKGWHKDAGNGGSFSSASDFAGMTQRAVQADRDAQTANYKGMFAGLDDFNSFKDEMKKKATGEEAAAPVIEKSDRLKGVEDRLENAAAGSTNRPPSLFDEENTPPAGTDDQKQAASNFLEDYKLDVVKGANLKHDIDEGLSNASRAVRDAYGR